VFSEHLQVQLPHANNRMCISNRLRIQRSIVDAHPSLWLLEKQDRNAPRQCTLMEYATLQPNLLAPVTVQ
jgi:hypothetical protein